MNGIPLVPRNSRLQQTQQNKISGKLPVDEEETEAPGENDLATDKEIVFFHDGTTSAYIYTQDQYTIRGFNVVYTYIIYIYIYTSAC